MPAKRQVRGPPELFDSTAAAADGSSGSIAISSLPRIPKLKSVVIKVEDIAKVTKKDTKTPKPVSH